MRKTLYPHIFLLTEGRLGCVVFALFPIWFLLMEVKSLALGGFNFADLLGIVVSSAVIAATFFYFIPHYWPLCFGKLTLTENYVKWHGLFIRSVKIPYSELRHVEIRQFREGNVMRNADLYRTGQEYVLMSVDSLPKTRIDKIRSGDGLIKYQFLMRDAAGFLHTKARAVHQHRPHFVSLGGVAFAPRKMNKCHYIWFFVLFLIYSGIP